MAERYKSIFFTILTLAVVWFLIILLCLSQSDTSIEEWSAKSSISSPLISGSSSSSKQVVNFIQVHDSIEDSDFKIGSRRYSNNNVKSSYNIKSPLSLDFLKNLQSKHRGISVAGTLFYQLDLNPRELFNSSVINKEQHDRETLLLGSINNPADQYVKSEGQGLFAFNLLVSNRIGLFRPLPDTRNAKCHKLTPQNPPPPPPPPLVPSSRQQTKYRHEPQQQNTSTQLYHQAKLIKLQASVIICYYNEAPSALLRTIYTVLKRSPVSLLKEIIVVDDSSSHEFDYNKIKAFVKSDLVKLVRTNKREGLIRARLFGANLAQGDVLIFLDSHVEANIGWLEPLLRVIQENSTTICCPMIDLINAETLIYSASPMVKGGLNWALNFKWDSVPSEDLKTYDDFVKPIDSPTMAGGLYAIDRQFFKKLGEYDQGMELWGGENIELSLRAWMCGGKIVILPCSRLGHIFRKRRPYGPEPDQPDSLLINSHRTARVWLDDYIYKFYEANPDAKYLVSGDVTQRLELRHKLGCHNFSWYLDNIYPTLKKELNDRNELPFKNSSKTDLFNLVPKRADRASTKRVSGEYAGAVNNRMQRQVDIIVSNTTQIINDRFHHGQHGFKYNNKQLPRMVSQFQIQMAGSDFCIESKGGFLAKGFTRLVLNHCAEIKRNNDNEILINNSTILDQIWSETELHDYRLGDNQCLDLLKNLPLLRKCHNMGSFQEWTHHDKSSNTSISNPGATLCLGVERIQLGEPIIVTICDLLNHHKTLSKHKHSNNGNKYVWKYKHADRLMPSWRTSSTHFSRRYLSGAAGSLGALRPNQRWNLLFVETSKSQSPATSVLPQTTASTNTLRKAL